MRINVWWTLSEKISSKNKTGRQFSKLLCGIMEWRFLGVIRNFMATMYMQLFNFRLSPRYDSRFIKTCGNHSVLSSRLLQLRSTSLSIYLHDICTIYYISSNKIYWHAAIKYLALLLINCSMNCNMKGKLRITKLRKHEHLFMCFFGFIILLTSFWVIYLFIYLNTKI